MKINTDIPPALLKLTKSQKYLLVFLWICLKLLIPLIIPFYYISFILMASEVLPIIGLKDYMSDGLSVYMLTMYLLNIYQFVVVCLNIGAVVVYHLH